MRRSAEMRGELPPSLRTFAKIRAEAAVKQLNVYPLVMLLIAVLFLIAWLGGYL